ncbi:hypothetical protein B0H19DRAFT_1080135 [Mycena capillaripes]|nr:hypothetical protein B0H19DRAFT_1080135 [Mycena capillaripes]
MSCISSYVQDLESGRRDDNLGPKREQFQKKLDRFLDGFVAPPGAQQAFLKYTVASSNEAINPHIQALEFPVAEPTVVIHFEGERYWLQFLLRGLITQVLCGDFEECGNRKVSSGRSFSGKIQPQVVLGMPPEGTDSQTDSM